MAQYIYKSALAAEIEKRIKETESMKPKFDQFWAGQISAFKGVLKILDTLEVKEVQEESVSEELEEASKKYSSCIYLEEVLSDDDREVLKERLVNTFKAGAEWQKEQIMKDAVYGLVCGHDDNSPAWIDLNLLNKPNVNVGEEIKLIIIKEE